MAIQGANLSYVTPAQSQVFNNAGLNSNSDAGVGGAQGKTGDFKSFLGDQTESFLKETKAVEQKVELFSQGKLDIESVASEVATMSIKIEAAKRTAEELKTGIHSLLNMQM